MQVLERLTLIMKCLQSIACGIHSQVDNWLFNSWANKKRYHLCFIFHFYVRSIYQVNQESLPAFQCSWVHVCVAWVVSEYLKVFCGFKYYDFPWIGTTNPGVWTFWDPFEHRKVTFFCRSLCRYLCVCVCDTPVRTHTHIVGIDVYL